MPGTVYRSRRIRATARQHLADAGIGLTVGVVLALLLYLVTPALAAQVSALL